jgi:hypothetical protein
MPYVAGPVAERVGMMKNLERLARIEVKFRLKHLRWLKSKSA